MQILQQQKELKQTNLLPLLSMFTNSQNRTNFNIFHGGDHHVGASIEDIFAIDNILPLVKPQKILIRFSFYFICNNNHMDETFQYPPSLPISVQ
jgi:hypothetical protein